MALDFGYIDFDPEPPITPPAGIYAPEGMDYTDDKAEFMQRRAGKITASRMADMMAGGNLQVREKYMMQLAIERITGQPIRGGFQSRATRHGEAAENEAIELYSTLHDIEISKVGFVAHPKLSFAGCSPDALANEDGMAQIKAPDQHTHLAYWLSKKVPREYYLQMQWELTCTGRAWSDFVSFDPDQIPRLRLLVIRVERNPGLIAELENAATLFNAEVEDLVNLMRTL